MGITTIARETPSMQDSVDCDYYRTSGIFQGSDIYRFVGVMCTLQSYLHSLLITINLLVTRSLKHLSALE